MQRVMRAALCGLLLIGAATNLYAQAAGATPAAKATVDQLAWVAGAWSGTVGDRTVEQHWSAPASGTIMAMYRSIRGGKVTLYELLAIEQEGDGVVLRIKHFAPGPGLVGQEAKDESMNHQLVKVDGKVAVFEGGAAASPARITFTSPDANTLNIVVERQRDGKPVSTEFKYRRIAGHSSH